MKGYTAMKRSRKLAFFQNAWRPPSGWNRPALGSISGSTLRFTSRFTVTPLRSTTLHLARDSARISEAKSWP